MRHKRLLAMVAIRVRGTRRSYYKDARLSNVPAHSCNAVSPLVCLALSTLNECRIACGSMVLFVFCTWYVVAAHRQQRHTKCKDSYLVGLLRHSEANLPDTKEEKYRCEQLAIRYALG